MSTVSGPRISITALPKPPNASKSHHVVDASGKRSSFTNPWPSFRRQHDPSAALSVRFSSKRNFVPVPTDTTLLLPVQTPTWAGDRPSALRATWIGHASWAIEFPSASAAADGSIVERECGAARERGLTVLLDPVWSDRMSPVSFIGPKRFRPPPCDLADVSPPDLIVISHNHYDHLDLQTIKSLYFDLGGKQRSLRFLCGLGLKEWFLGIGIEEQHVIELDWWEGLDVHVRLSSTCEENGNKEQQTVRVTCTPSQHFSGRGIFDIGKALWCSWTFEDKNSGKKLYFAGDTGYRTITEEDEKEGKKESDLAVCPAFKEIGDKFGPFDLALLPIGCYTPRTFMSSVHCSPEDTVEVHKAIRSKRSVGMHYGSVRGGLSQYYEDVLEPPQRWKESCELAGLKWGEEVELCDLGETVVV